MDNFQIQDEQLAEVARRMGSELGEVPTLESVVLFCQGEVGVEGLVDYE